MPNTSSKTKPVAFRLPVDVHAIVKRRAFKQLKIVNEYLREKEITDATRKR